MRRLLRRPLPRLEGEVGYWTVTGMITVVSPKSSLRIVTRSCHWPVKPNDAVAARYRPGPVPVRGTGTGPRSRAGKYRLARTSAGRKGCPPGAVTVSFTWSGPSLAGVTDVRSVPAPPGPPVSNAE